MRPWASSGFPCLGVQTPLALKRPWVRLAAVTSSSSTPAAAAAAGTSSTSTPAEAAVDAAPTPMDIDPVTPLSSAAPAEPAQRCGQPRHGARLEADATCSETSKEVPVDGEAFV